MLILNTLSWCVPAFGCRDARAYLGGMNKFVPGGDRGSSCRAFLVNIRRRRDLELCCDPK